MKRRKHVPVVTPVPQAINDLLERFVSMPRAPYISPKEYIYLTKADFGYKIGRTTRPKLRPLQVAGNCPISLEVLVVMEVPNSRVAERQLHGHFFKKRLRGEWFKLDDQDIEVVRGYPDSLANLPIADEEDVPF